MNMTTNFLARLNTIFANESENSLLRHVLAKLTEEKLDSNLIENKLIESIYNPSSSFSLDLLPAKDEIKGNNDYHRLLNLSIELVERIRPERLKPFGK